MKHRGTKLLALEEANRGRVRDALVALFERGVASEHLAADHVAHLPGGVDLHGPGALVEYAERFRDGLGDVSVAEVETLAELDAVAVHLVLVGRHVGDVLGVPASGRTARVPVAGFVRLRYGELVESSFVFDTLAALVEAEEDGEETARTDRVRTVTDAR